MWSIFIKSSQLLSIMNKWRHYVTIIVTCYAFYQAVQLLNNFEPIDATAPTLTQPFAYHGCRPHRGPTLPHSCEFYDVWTVDISVLSWPHTLLCRPTYCMRNNNSLWKCKKLIFSLFGLNFMVVMRLACIGNHIHEWQKQITKYEKFIKSEHFQS